MKTILSILSFLIYYLQLSTCLHYSMTINKKGRMSNKEIVKKSFQVNKIAQLHLRVKPLQVKVKCNIVIVPACRGKRRTLAQWPVYNKEGKWGVLWIRRSQSHCFVRGRAAFFKGPEPPFFRQVYVYYE